MRQACVQSFQSMIPLIVSSPAFGTRIVVWLRLRPIRSARNLHPRAMRSLSVETGQLTPKSSAKSTFSSQSPLAIHISARSWPLRYQNARHAICNGAECAETARNCQSNRICQCPFGRLAIGSFSGRQWKLQCQVMHGYP